MKELLALFGLQFKMTIIHFENVILELHLDAIGLIVHANECTILIPFTLLYWLTKLLCKLCKLSAYSLMKLLYLKLDCIKLIG